MNAANNNQKFTRLGGSSAILFRRNGCDVIAWKTENHGFALKIGANVYLGWSTLRAAVIGARNFC